MCVCVHACVRACMRACMRACVRRPDLGRIWFGCFKVSRHVAFVRLFKRLVNNGRQNTIQPAVKGTGVVFKVVIWTGR